MGWKWLQRGVRQQPVKELSSATTTGVFEMPRTPEFLTELEHFSQRSTTLNPQRNMKPFDPTVWRLFMEMRSDMEQQGYRYYAYRYDGELRARFMLNVNEQTPDYLVDELGPVIIKPANLEALPRNPNEPSGGKEALKFAIQQGIAVRGSGTMYVNSSGDAYGWYTKLGFVESQVRQSKDYLYLTHEAALRLLGDE